MARYKVTIRQEEAQIKSVSNDYVKFLRIAQDYIERSGAGIINGDRMRILTDLCFEISTRLVA